MCSMRKESKNDDIPASQKNVDEPVYELSELKVSAMLLLRFEKSHYINPYSLLFGHNKRPNTDYLPCSVFCRLHYLVLMVKNPIP